MTKMNQTKICPCCTENPGALMAWIGNGWICTVCSYMEFVTEDDVLDWDVYVPVPPKRSFAVKVKLKYRGKGKP